MASWTVPGFLDTLKATLDTAFAASAIPTTKVYTAPMDLSKSASNVILGTRVTGSQEWGAIGTDRKNDSYVVECAVFVSRRGAGESVAKVARDAADAILAIVEAELRTTIGGATATFATSMGANQLRKLAVTDVSLDQGATDNQRWALISFNVAVEASI